MTVGAGGRLLLEGPLTSQHLSWNSRSFPIQDHDQYRLSHAQQARLRLRDRGASRDVSVVTGNSTDLQAPLGRRACSTVTCANPLSH